ncbi:MAG TPA: tetratricopeptide repeat protein [Polyangia bacterium]|jgi:hypothetical protein|nr:tetratricopeptide repeat protein [Polyangia bacterium]
MHSKTILAGVIFMLSGLISTIGRAEPCPTPGSDETQARRRLAKQWFSRAEESESSGERDIAVKQYACSLRLVPHPSTAYNLAVAAERSGDPSMAVEAFRAYLRLLPDAPDRGPTEARIGRLEGQVLELRQKFDDGTPGRGLAKTKTVASSPRFVPERDPDQLPPLPMPDSSSPSERRIPPWPLFAGAAATAGTGLIFNLVARAKMTTCRDPQLRSSSLAVADAACSSARPYAYGSYALLGLGAALGVAGGILIFQDGGSDGPTLSVSPNGTGGALNVSGAF